MSMPPRPSSPATATPLRRVDDAVLVALIRSGDESAFTELHRRHRPALRRLAGAILRGTAHDPDDVLQEAFVSAYIAMRAVDRPIAPRAWLSMIVRNKAIDAVREPHAARVEPDSERQLALVPATLGDPSDVACLREEVRDVVSAIGRLPDRQRLALVRRELQGQPVGEVAAGLGTNVSSTWSLLHRARATVKADRRRTATLGAA